MAHQTLDEVRQRIAGDEPVLLIEAPAGYGKTTEAVRATSTIAPTLPPGKKVLFLTHTNGARENFNKRLGSGAAEMLTIHALAARIVETFARPLGLPRPLEPHLGKPSFAEMISLAVHVLDNRREVAAGLAARYPVILVDEYQDCGQGQHDLVFLIARAGEARLRLFGDHLQGIFGREDEGAPSVDFAAMEKEHPSVALTTAHRWAQNPGMQGFVVAARGALDGGRAIDVRNPPPCVRVVRWDGPVPGAGQKGGAAGCFDAVKAAAPRTGAMIISHHNSHVRGLGKRLPMLGSLHEGSDTEGARKALQQAVEAAGDPVALTAALADTMTKLGTGLQKKEREQLSEVCTAAGIELGSKKKIAELAGLCGGLYEEPTVDRWLSCLRRVLDGEHGLSWKVFRRDQLYLLAALHPGDGESPLALLHQESQARSARRRKPTRGFMTIHKAKGLEFDSVIVPYCSGADFPDTPYGRKLLYVALSRPQREVHLLVPNEDPSPLLQLA